MQNNAYNSLAGAGVAERVPTALESHLKFLSELNGKLYTAVERAEKCATRLLGPEPQPIRDNVSSNTIKTQDTPMTRQLEMTVMQLMNLADDINSQLSRLERV